MKGPIAVWLTVYASNRQHFRALLTEHAQFGICGMCPGLSAVGQLLRCSFLTKQYINSTFTVITIMFVFFYHYDIYITRYLIPDVWSCWLLTNTADPDQTAPKEQSDLVLHCVFQEEGSDPCLQCFPDIIAPRPMVIMVK